MILILKKIINKLKKVSQYFFKLFLNQSLIKKVRAKITILIAKNKVKNNYQEGKKIKIIIGAEGDKQNNWISTNQETLDLLKEADWKNIFKESSIDAILAEHIMEHLTENEGIKALKICFKYLKPLGHVRIAVPDAYCPNKNYINYVKPGGYGRGSDDHKSFYNYQSLSRLLKIIGYEIVLLEYYNENGQLINNEWSPNDGFIERSIKYDSRNQAGKINYTSLIIDGIKPE